VFNNSDNGDSALTRLLEWLNSRKQFTCNTWL